VYSASKNDYLSTFDITDLKLDFTGTIIESKTTHSKTGVTTNLVTFDYYTYDNADRMLRHTQKVGNTATELITFNKYDELGAPEEKKIGRGAVAATLTGISLINGVYTKTAATASWTNATLATNTVMAGNGNLSFKVGNYTDNQLRIGLSYTPATTLYTQINYHISLTATVSGSGGKVANIMELGIVKYVTNYLPGDEFTLERINNTIFYKKNGALLYQSAISVTQANLYGDSHFYTIGSNIEDLQVNNYTYANANALQVEKYKFNVRGMLTKINDPATNGTGSLFNMEIRYDDPTSGGTAYYDGNVSQIFWNSATTTATTRNYNFTYDHLHRLMAANYIKKENNIVTTGMYNENCTYDNVGNIITLNRNGSNDITPTTIDAIFYTYDGNRLIAVNDTSNNTEGFTNGANTSLEYTYDDDGNMISDANKKITNIVYNEMNLPTRINFTANSLGQARFIDFVYDSQGEKLSKYSVDGKLKKILAEYAGDYVYVTINDKTTLQYISQVEGYISYNTGVFSYVYQSTDHLGNVRLAYTDVDKDGLISDAQNYQDSFEQGRGWNTSWSNVGTLTYDTQNPHSGTYSGKINNLGTAENYAHSDYEMQINNAVATSYTVSGWVRGTGATAEVLLLQKTEPQSGYPAATSIYYGSTNAGWTSFTLTVSVPANIKKLLLRLDNNGGGTVWFDDIQIKRATINTEIVEESNYYPFGLKHKGYTTTTTLGNAFNKIGFQGQELQEDIDLNWSSFKWRNYDPAVGRFFSIDPLAEKYSHMTPYQFSSNQPMHASELEGMESSYELDDVQINGSRSVDPNGYLDQDRDNDNRRFNDGPGVIDLSLRAVYRDPVKSINLPTMSIAMSAPLSISATPLPTYSQGAPSSSGEGLGESFLDGFIGGDESTWDDGFIGGDESTWDDGDSPEFSPWGPTLIGLGQPIYSEK